MDFESLKFVRNKNTYKLLEGPLFFRTACHNSMLCFNEIMPLRYFPIN